MAVQVFKDHRGRHGRAGVGVGDAVSDRHQNSRWGAVPTDVGDEDAPLVDGEREEVVVVAARLPRRPVRGGEVERGNCRQPGCRRERLIAPTALNSRSSAS